MTVKTHSKGPVLLHRNSCTETLTKIEFQSAPEQRLPFSLTSATKELLCSHVTPPGRKEMGEEADDRTNPARDPIALIIPPASKTATSCAKVKTPSRYRLAYHSKPKLNSRRRNLIIQKLRKDFRKEKLRHISYAQTHRKRQRLIKAQHAYSSSSSSSPSSSSSSSSFSSSSSTLYSNPTPFTSSSRAALLSSSRPTTSTPKNDDDDDDDDDDDNTSDKSGLLSTQGDLDGLRQLVPALRTTRETSQLNGVQILNDTVDYIKELQQKFHKKFSSPHDKEKAEHFLASRLEFHRQKFQGQHGTPS